ncbi:hypothetical protein GINT2_001964, partial [Glugoides intestinalis]
QDFERKITLTTLRRETKMLNIQTITPEEKYRNVYIKSNMDVMDWLIENKISDWKKLMACLSKEEKEEKYIELMTICSQSRLPTENEIIFLENKIEELRKFKNIPEKLVIRMLSNMAWPGNWLRINEACLTNDTETLLDNSKRKAATPTPKYKSKCKICKKNNHETENCRYKRENLERKTQTNA